MKMVQFTRDSLSVAEFNRRFNRLSAVFNFNEEALRSIYLVNVGRSQEEFLRRQGLGSMSLDRMMELALECESPYLPLSSGKRPQSVLMTKPPMTVSKDTHLDRSKSACHNCGEVGHFSGIYAHGTLFYLCFLKQIKKR